MRKNRSSTKRDRLFQAKRALPADFSFGKETSAVFDDMLHRSVPLYDEMQRMIRELASDFAVEGTNLYDLGCSTGNTLLMLDPVVPKGVRFVGVDSSPQMLDRAREKLKQHGVKRPCDLIHADLNRGLQISNASVLVMSLTLQFVRPLYRHQLMRSLAAGVLPEGCLILVEKVLPAHSLLNRLFIKHYYEFKQQQGYSKLEISQKREALENVLVPYRLEENLELLKQSGFSQFDVFFKWYNFCGLLAVK